MSKIIAEATNRAGKLVQICEHEVFRSGLYDLLIDGQLVAIGEGSEHYAFFQACQEGCGDEPKEEIPALNWIEGSPRETEFGIFGQWAATEFGVYGIVLRTLPPYTVDLYDAITPDGEGLGQCLEPEEARKAAEEHYNEWKKKDDR